VEADPEALDQGPIGHKQAALVFVVHEAACGQDAMILALSFSLRLDRIGHRILPCLKIGQSK
jgi:hypothetical protein